MNMLTNKTVWTAVAISLLAVAAAARFEQGREVLLNDRKFLGIF